MSTFHFDPKRWLAVAGTLLAVSIPTVAVGDGVVAFAKTVAPVRDYETKPRNVALILADDHRYDAMPVTLAGGGFQHGQHLAFDKVNNTPLSNLFVSMLQRAGLGEVDNFAISTGSPNGLEMA